MAFWRFGFAQDGGVDALLKHWDASGSSSPGSDAGAGSEAGGGVNGHSQEETQDVGSKTAGGMSASSSGSGIHLAGPLANEPGQSIRPTLEQLLEEEDLLQECKTGHAKLLDYLASPYAVKRMLAYISGEAFQGQPIPASVTAPANAATLESGSEATSAPPDASEDDREAVRKRLKYPYLCSEIITMDPWQVTDTIFRDTDNYLVPFWNAILDQPSETLVAISVQVGHWSKINNQWLTNTRTPQMIQFLKTFPDLLPRMLKHLPYISPIADILNKLVVSDENHPQLGIISWLHEAQLVPLVVDLLDPVKSPVAAHTPAGDLLRGIVAASSAASASKQQQLQQAQARAGDGESNGQGHASAWAHWPNNSLVRDLASIDTVRRLLGFVLDSETMDRQPSSVGAGTASQATPIDEEGETERDAVTPTRADTPNVPGPAFTRTASPEAVTSSLLNSLTLIIDIIRKNNSDFTELQILQYLERAHGGFDPDAEDESGDMAGEGEEDIGRINVMEQGPSLVDLEPLLRELTRRLPDLHKLLRNPRSSIEPVPSTLQGLERQEPLTFERFRICELYAELLHCSNMAILNRPPQPEEAIPAPAYDATTGRIQGTRKQAFERLGHALNATDPSPGVSPETHLSERLPNGDGTAPGQTPDEEERPVTAQSDVTSSYTSGASESADDKEDSEDVFDALNSATEGLSLDDDAASLHFPNSNPPSASNSPMPPHSAQFSSMPSPQKGSALQNGDLDSPPAMAPADRRKPNASTQKQSLAPPLLTGQALKRAFVDLQVVPAVLDLFFRFPWNNFLHNVVYDLVQQIFNGKLEIGLNRELCVAVFTQEGGLIERLLDAVEQNNSIIAEPNGVRLGHMGHLTLISEEIVKLFYDNTNEILSQIPESIFDRTRWETFVEGTLRETRERDLQPLGGGISMAMHGSASAGSAGHAGIVDIDDEFPAAGQGRNFYVGEGEGASSSPGTSPDKAHFARYLASQISSDLPGQPGQNALNTSTSSSSSSSSGSSSSDDAPGHTDYQGSPRRQTSGLDKAAATWFSGGNEGDSAFDDYDDDDEGTSALGPITAKKGQGADFANVHVSQTRKIHDSTAGIARQERFGFDDRFDVNQFGTGDSDDDEDLTPGEEDDDAFGPFSDSYAAPLTPTGSSHSKGLSFDDDFGSSSTATLKDIRDHPNLTPADWNSSFRSNYDSAQPSFGEFGDFSAADDDDDDEFGDFAGSSDQDHGDYDFTQSTGPTSPLKETFSPTSPKSRSSMTRSASAGQEVVGPGVHEGAHISSDGKHVEAEIEVDGKKVTVQVPRDELALHPEIIDKEQHLPP